MMRVSQPDDSAKSRTTPGDGAFTLLEILLVVVIILMGTYLMWMPNFLEAQTRAQVSAAKAELHTVAGALEAYFLEHRAYPPNVIKMTGAPRQLKPSQAKTAGVLESRHIRLRGNTWLYETRDSVEGRLGKNNVARVPDCPLYYNGAALVRVTTPMAYIGHLPPQQFPPPFDPSKPPPLYRPPPVWGPVAPSVQPTWDLWGQRPYGYYNFLEIDPDGVMLPEARHAVAYILVSPGPSRTLDFTDPSLPALTIYDPTNGTISTGDIVVFGSE